MERTGTSVPAYRAAMDPLEDEIWQLLDWEAIGDGIKPRAADGQVRHAHGAVGKVLHNATEEGSSDDSTEPLQCQGYEPQRLDPVYATATGQPISSTTEVEQGSSDGSSKPLQCWGYELMHLVVHAHAPATVCQPISSSCNTSTFRNKFCSTCSAAMLLPLSHVRALPLALEGQFCNGKGIGLWSHAPSAPNTCFRVINQTAKCHGPKLVVFHERPDGVDLDWDPIPSNWLEDGMLPVVVAKGTLVPTRALVRLPAVGMWAPAMASLTGAVNLTSANKGPAEHAWSCYSARGIKRLGWDAGGEGADGKEEAIKRQVSAVLDGNGGVRHAAPIPVLARLHSAPVHARPLIWEPVHTASLARALGFAPPLPREQMHTAPLHSAQARTAPLSLPPPPPHETCISGLPVGKAVRKAVRVRMREIGSSRGILAPLPQSKEELLRLADSKLMPAGMRAQRIFLGADEISSDTFGLIQNDDIIYISAGENWIAPPEGERERGRGGERERGRGWVLEDWELPRRVSCRL